MSRGDERRALIADHAIAVLAEGGARALTHKAVDAHAGLPAGSASYHFRSRSALVGAVVERIRQGSREAFDAARTMMPDAAGKPDPAAAWGVAGAADPAGVLGRSGTHGLDAEPGPAAPGPDAGLTLDAVTAVMTEHLRLLTSERRAPALAVLALLPEVAGEPRLRDALTRCLFSRALAVELLQRLGSPEPEADAADLLDLLTGMLVTRLFADGPGDPARPIARFLRTCVGPRDADCAQTAERASCADRAEHAD
ncbi:TetR/AcrR family transcriptional regulator [Brevibacterium album]|uniref:TetR/AcrR family transcriptional regulator n=1 Tax=Brevibacterium album TaxID=417948 RepID=UPI0003FE9694|nr:TetR family transcriptional regulator [Brevibacterium album]